VSQYEEPRARGQPISRSLVVLERFEECLMLEPNGRVASLRSLLWCLH
jgi:hypothetical protein